MKKFLLGLAVIATTTFTSNAEGYQVNTLSARQNGMGHTGTALKLGSESMIFNPAGLGYLQKQIDARASVSGIFATATCDVRDSGSFKTDNSASTPISVNLGFRIYDSFSAGISFYTPYGSNINWGENWPGAILNQSVKLSVYTIQPTFAYRPLKNLSIGAGLMISWGNVNLDKGLVNPATFSMILPSWATQYGLTMPASVNLNGKSAVALGVNLGVMYDIDSRWTVGISYRSKMNMKVRSGNASLHFANDMAKAALESTLGLIDKARFKAEMPCVSIINFGVSYKPLDKLTLAADAQLSLWNEYRELNIIFPDQAIPNSFNQEIPKNYHNSWTWHLGAEYNLTERFDIRAGIMIDSSPINRHNYNPETPGMTKIEPSIGFSFRPVPSFSIDFGMLYVAGLGVDNASVTYNDMLANVINTQLGKPVVSPTQTFTADYKVHAVIPSIGVSFTF